MIDLRLAKRDDSNDIFAWRNDEHTRVMSITTEIVKREDHEKWFIASLRNVNRVLLIGEKGNSKIGVCRFDYNENNQKTTVSINLNPGMRGKNLGMTLLRNAINFYRKNNQSELNATIKKENIASIKCFEKTGFVFLHEDDTYKYYRLD